MRRVAGSLGARRARRGELKDGGLSVAPGRHGPDALVLAGPQGLAPGVPALPVEQHHLHARLRAIQGVLRVVVHQDVGAHVPADLGLATGGPLEREVVPEVHLGEDAREVRLEPLARLLLDAVLPRGHDDQVAAGPPQALQALARAAHGGHAVPEVLRLEEGVHAVVRGLL